VPVHDVTSSLTVAENAVGADIVPLALIEVMDPDAADADMLTGDAGIAAIEVSDPRFEVIKDPVDGLWLALKADVSLDYETEQSVTVTVTFTDSAGNEAEADATVTVVDGNEAPSAPVVRNADSLEVNENAEGAQIGVLELSTDPEGDGISYEVDDTRFEIDDNGALMLKEGMSINHEEEAEVTLMLTARDDASPAATSAATMVTVTVHDLNEAPDVVGEVQDMLFGSAGDEVTMQVALDELFLDPDEGDQPVRYRLSGGPDWDDGTAAMTVNYETITVTAPTVTVGALEDAADEDAGGLLLRINIADPDIATLRSDEFTVDVAGDHRLEARMDDDGIWWVALRDGQTIGEDDNITVTVTVTDNGHRHRQWRPYG
jgi:hypothetical protein